MEKFSPEEIRKSEEERIKNLSPEYKKRTDEERARVDKLSDYELLNEVVSEAEEKIKEARERSLTDELTGIRNRRALEKIAPEILNIERRNMRKFSLLMIDIDRFKEINDTLGHRAGDEILKALPGEIGKNIRRADFMCRYGGDEFIILLPDTDIQGAVIIAEKIRKAIEENEKYTLSIGIFNSEHLPEDKWKNYNELNSSLILEEMINQADKAMYKAKEDGGNKAVLFREDLKDSR